MHLAFADRRFHLTLLLCWLLHFAPRGSESVCPYSFRNAFPDPVELSVDCDQFVASWSTPGFLIENYRVDYHCTNGSTEIAALLDIYISPKHSVAVDLPSSATPSPSQVCSYYGCVIETKEEGIRYFNTVTCTGPTIAIPSTTSRTPLTTSQTLPTPSPSTSAVTPSSSSSSSSSSLLPASTITPSSLLPPPATVSSLPTPQHTSPSPSSVLPSQEHTSPPPLPPTPAVSDSPPTFPAHTSPEHTAPSPSTPSPLTAHTSPEHAAPSPSTSSPLTSHTPPISKPSETDSTTTPGSTRSQEDTAHTNSINIELPEPSSQGAGTTALAVLAPLLLVGFIAAVVTLTILLLATRHCRHKARAGTKEYIKRQLSLPMLHKSFNLTPDGYLEYVHSPLSSKPPCKAPSEDQESITTFLERLYDAEHDAKHFSKCSEFTPSTIQSPDSMLHLDGDGKLNSVNFSFDHTGRGLSDRDYYIMGTSGTGSSSGFDTSAGSFVIQERAGVRQLGVDEVLEMCGDVDCEECGRQGETGRVGVGVGPGRDAYGGSMEMEEESPDSHFMTFDDSDDCYRGDHVTRPS